MIILNPYKGRTRFLRKCVYEYLHITLTTDLESEKLEADIALNSVIKTFIKYSRVVA